MAGVVPNLHFLPSLLANPSLGLIQQQISAAAANLPAAATSGISAATHHLTTLKNQNQSSTASSSGNQGGPVGAGAPSLSSSNITQNLSSSLKAGIRADPAKALEQPQSTSEVPGGAKSAVSDVRIATGIRDLKDNNVPIFPTNMAGINVSNVGGKEAIGLYSTLEAEKLLNQENIEKLVEKISEKNPREYLKNIINPKGIVFNITISTVILSAFVFIAVITWIEFLRSWYDQTFDPTLGIRNIKMIFIRFWYAVFITSISIIFVYIFHRWALETKD